MEQIVINGTGFAMEQIIIAGAGIAKGQIIIAATGFTCKRQCPFKETLPLKLISMPEEN